MRPSFSRPPCIGTYSKPVPVRADEPGVYGSSGGSELARLPTLSIAHVKLVLGCPCAVNALPVGPDGEAQLTASHRTAHVNFMSTSRRNQPQ
jgi:hypothetical protein